MATKIQNQVMKRVYLIWFSKKILPYILAEIFALGAFLYLVGEYTFVRVIADNLTRLLFSSPLALPTYLAEAVINTKFVVQISVVGALAAALLISKNMLAALIQLRVFREETILRRGVFY